MSKFLRVILPVLLAIWGMGMVSLSASASPYHQSIVIKAGSISAMGNIEMSPSLDAARLADGFYGQAAWNGEDTYVGISWRADSAFTLGDWGAMTYYGDNPANARSSGLILADNSTVMVNATGLGFAVPSEYLDVPLIGWYAIVGTYGSPGYWSDVDGAEMSTDSVTFVPTPTPTVTPTPWATATNVSIINQACYTPTPAGVRRTFTPFTDTLPACREGRCNVFTVPGDEAIVRVPCVVSGTYSVHVVTGAPFVVAIANDGVNSGSFDPALPDVVPSIDVVWHGTLTESQYLEMGFFSSEEPLTYWYGNSQVYWSTCNSQPLQTCGNGYTLPTYTGETTSTVTDIFDTVGISMTTPITPSCLLDMQKSYTAEVTALTGIEGAHFPGIRLCILPTTVNSVFFMGIDWNWFVALGLGAIPMFFLIRSFLKSRS